MLGDGGIGVLIDDHEVKVAVCFQDRVDGQFVIIADSGDGGAAGLYELGAEFFAEVVGVGDIGTSGGRVVMIRVAEDSLVSALRQP